MEWVVIPFSRLSSNLGIESRSLVLQEDSLLSEPLGKPQVWAAQCNLWKYLLLSSGSDGKDSPVIQETQVQTLG